jgi:hypothetical protein
MAVLRNFLFPKSQLMTLHHRWLVSPLVVLAAAWIVGPGTCRAQLLPPGDFNGTSFEQWGLDYALWALPLTHSAGVIPFDPSRPDTFNGVRFLPVGEFGIRDFTANLTIQPGTAIFTAPFFIYGERYDDGHEDDPADPIVQMILDDTTLRTTLDGTVVLEGTPSSLSDRVFGIYHFPEPIPYTEPQQRGPDGSPIGEGLFAVASAWTTGTGTMFANLSPGEHTLRNEYNSEFFGGAYSSTYNITVLPEPATGVLVGIASVLGLGWAVRGRFRRGRSAV